MRLVFRVHAVQRMFQYRISEDDVRHVLEGGETIKNYPDDTPYPSRVVLGWLASRDLYTWLQRMLPIAEVLSSSRSMSRTQSSGSRASGGKDHEVRDL